MLAPTLCLAACGAGATGVGAGHGSPAGGTVLVRGHVGLFGGPLDPKTGLMALRDSPAAQARVSATSGTTTVAATTTGTDGRFVLHLPPGSYLLKPECGVGRRLVVPAQRPVQIALSCDVP